MQVAAYAAHHKHVHVITLISMGSRRCSVLLHGKQCCHASGVCCGNFQCFFDSWLLRALRQVVRPVRWLLLVVCAGWATNATAGNAAGCYVRCSTCWLQFAALCAADAVTLLGLEQHSVPAELVAVHSMLA
jgi:hypothetical protein